MKGDHTRRGEGYTLVYWKDNTACGEGDEWTRCEVSADGFYPSFTVFRDTDLVRLTGMLTSAYRAGKAARSTEIAKLLGVKE